MDYRLPTQGISVSEAVAAMTNIILALEQDGKPPIYQWSDFRNIMTKGDSRLKCFFDDLCNAVHPLSKGGATIDTTLRGLVNVCYMLCGLRNHLIKGFKRDVALFLDLAGTSDDGIDAMQRMGMASSSRSVYRTKNEIAKRYGEHVASTISPHVERGRALIGNLDDYHNIHMLRRPDTTSTTWTAHVATNILIPMDIPAFPISITSSFSGLRADLRSPTANSDVETWPNVQCALHSSR
jgi:hypothetical protein